MGLGPYSNDKSELLVEELGDQGILKRKVFAFLIGTGWDISTAQFGGYKPGYAKEEIKWHYTVNPYYWSLSLKGAWLNGVSLKTKARQVIIDTGTSFTLIPDTDFK